MAAAALLSSVLYMWLWIARVTLGLACPKALRDGDEIDAGASQLRGVGVPARVGHADARCELVEVRRHIAEAEVLPRGW